MAKPLKKIAKLIRQLSYVDTETMACELRPAVVERQNDPEMDFDVEKHTDWMDLLQSWAEGELDR